MPMHTEVPKYDKDIAKEFEEEGLSADEAVRVASTTMDGVNQEEREVRGGKRLVVHGTQTACDDPNATYPEDAPYSEAPAIGRATTRAAMREELNLPEGADLNKAVNDWIEAQGEKVDKK